MTDLVPPPDPGVYRDVPMSRYHEWDAASNSQLSRLMKSPAHLRAYREDEYDESPAMRLGRVIHKAVLEPAEFEDGYVVLGQCEATKGDGERCTNSASILTEQGQFCGVQGHADGEPDEETEVISESDRRTALNIRQSIQETTAAKSVLSGEGDVEVCAVWEDDETGVMCKARADRITSDLPGGALVDLKTTRDASIDSFHKDLFNYSYYLQANFYLRGFRSLGYDIEHFLIVAVEKEPPYAVGPPYRLFDHESDLINGLVDQLLDTYGRCVRTDEWPGYPDHVEDIGLPSWADRKIEGIRNHLTHLREEVDHE